MFPEDFKVEDISRGEERKTDQGQGFEDHNLSQSVVEHDEEVVKDGQMMSEALNEGFSAFHPDSLFDMAKKDFAMAKNVYGESLYRLLSGYDPRYIDKNIRIPEFQKDLQNRMTNKFNDLQEKGLVTKEGEITDKGIDLASLILYTEELDRLIPQGMVGDRIHKKYSHYGEKAEVSLFKKGDRYRDIAIKRSVRTALRRGHTKLSAGDLRVFERKSKGSVQIIYGLDASGSMKGKKMETAKKAGIALAFKAISEKDKVGLVVFNSEVTEAIAPTLDFRTILRQITQVRAARQTNMRKMIEKSLELFTKEEITKHLFILTDAHPTVGDDPEKEVLELVSLARARGITISLAGISLEDKGVEFAKKVAGIGEGRLYLIKHMEELDSIILEDYNYVASLS